MKETFEDYLKKVIAILIEQADGWDEATAKVHAEGMMDFYRDCYNDNVSPYDAVAEDMSEWTE